MCRWIAYAGAPIPMDLLVLRPEHSLLVQSLHATHSHQTTNGDGFGLGWYGELPTPAVYRDIRPAWNDENLHDLATHTRSRMFMAHVRAATGTPIQRTNCHPFRHGRWLFQHNGLVPEFGRLKRDLLLAVAPERFADIEGSTDSEVLFHVALTYGLDDDAHGALARTVGHVERLRRGAGIEAPFHFTAAFADGHAVHAVRYASHGPARSLFTTQDAAPLRAIDPTLEFPEGSILVASEPLGSHAAYEEVPESTYLVAGGGCVERRPFAPAPDA